MVADRSIGFLPNPVSPVVVASSFGRVLFPLGLAAASKKRRFKVAHYPSVGAPITFSRPPTVF
jgi:hypothetical protein